CDHLVVARVRQAMVCLGRSAVQSGYTDVQLALAWIHRRVFTDGVSLLCREFVEASNSQFCFRQTPTPERKLHGFQPREQRRAKDDGNYRPGFVLGDARGPVKRPAELVAL